MFVPVSDMPVVHETAVVHPVAHVAPVKRANVVTVKSGDTLTSIAAKNHTPGGWDSIFAANRAISNPNVITVGERLRLPDHRMSRPFWAPPPVPVAPAPVASAPASGPVTTVAATEPAPPAYHAPVPSAPAAHYSGSSSMQQCIISRESGGNSQVMNSSGHYGLYQFSSSTWAASGGNPADFGHASVAEQNQVFNNAVAARGYSDWTPYDGC